MKNNTKTMNINLIVGLIPVFLFGLYKNGIFLYTKGLINFVGVFKPILLVLIGFCLSILVNYILEENKKEFNIFNNINLFDGVLVAMLMPPQINLFVFTIINFILLILSNILFKKFKFNKVAFIKILFFIIFLIFKIDYQNLYEITSSMPISNLDYFIGFGVGGVLSTSNIGILVGFIFLFSRYSYKKDIPIYICTSFFIILFIYGLMQGELIMPMKLLLNNSILFASVFVATDTLSSPYTKKGKGFYGIIVGIITAISIILFKTSISVFIAIFLISIIFPFLDRIFYQKEVKE